MGKIIYCQMLNKPLKIWPRTFKISHCDEISPNLVTLMTSEASVPSLYFVLSTASTQLNHNLTVGSNQTFWSPLLQQHHMFMLLLLLMLLLFYAVDHLNWWTNIKVALHTKWYTIELFCSKRWRLVDICPFVNPNLVIVLHHHALSQLFCKFINTTDLDRYEPSSPVSCHTP